LHVVAGDLHGDDLVCLRVYGEVELHVALLLSVFSLDPAAGFLDLYAGGVDCDGDGVTCLLEDPVGVDE